MIEQLFGSKTRVKLLQLFYKNPKRSFYVREITRKIDEQINSVRRELANLLSIGIITSDNSNNKLYYEVNQKFEYYDSLSKMFGGSASKKSKKPAEKITGENAEGAEAVVLDEELVVIDEQNRPLLEALKKAGNINLAVITGQFTLDDRSGIDILVVGDINEVNLQNSINDIEQSEKKSLRYAYLPVEEFVYRKQVNDKFVSDVSISKKIILLDKDNLLN
jgi:predicted transcriptional regulator